MAFQSKINLARTYQADNGDSREIIKYLTKMLRDDKNKEFLDQIYYALADVAFKDGIDTLGIEYLRLSVARSVNNNYQRSTSSLELADIYFEMPEYELAEAYYDTAVNFLPEDYPNYEEIRNKADKLSQLVQNLQVVIREDSLQRIAAMPENERFQVIDKIITELVKEEQRQREEEYLRRNEPVFGQGQSFGSGMAIGGPKWYFYNPNTLSSGYSEFQKKWGNRELEDLWRLRDKKTINYEEDELLEAAMDSLAMAGDTFGMLALDPHNREYYLKDLPMSDEDLALSHKAIAEALYNLGLIYAEGLNNYEKSVESYEDLLSRYPEDSRKLMVYYQLYRLFLGIGDAEQAEYYKNIIINDYPDSDYALIIQNPDFYKEMAEKETALTRLYSRTYEAFERGQYFTVISNSDRAIRDNGDTLELIPKFLYLRALSIGKVDVVDSLAVALKDIIKDYPDSDVRPLAQNLLDVISRDRPDLGGGTSPAEQELPEVVSPYSYSPQGDHMYLLVVKRQAVKLNAMKVKLSDHNKKYFSTMQLTINSVLLDDNHYMITVGNFENASAALDYLNVTTGDPYVFSDLGSGNYTEAVISMENYPIFYREKNVNLYEHFFEKNYLK
jgi:tetratricopeptide (TPR) repeat protein